MPTISRLFRGKTLSIAVAQGVAYALAENDPRPTRRKSEEEWRDFDAELQGKYEAVEQAGLAVSSVKSSPTPRKVLASPRTPQNPVTPQALSHGIVVSAPDGAEVDLRAMEVIMRSLDRTSEPVVEQMTALDFEYDLRSGRFAGTEHFFAFFSRAQIWGMDRAAVAVNDDLNLDTLMERLPKAKNLVLLIEYDEDWSYFSQEALQSQLFWRAGESYSTFQLFGRFKSSETCFLVDLAVECMASRPGREPHHDPGYDELVSGLHAVHAARKLRSSESAGGFFALEQRDFPKSGSAA
ncbi:hypothetical protein ACFUTR_28930 [Streptomyces sp. NPDC057367]|uniref:hypothetical protein n=1 Tax=Streptomyces sp. NPDC057367 TaxID=3346108 RepID=UPI00362F2A90